MRRAHKPATKLSEVPFGQEIRPSLFRRYKLASVLSLLCLASSTFAKGWGVRVTCAVRRALRASVCAKSLRKFFVTRDAPAPPWINWLGICCLPCVRERRWMTFDPFFSTTVQEAAADVETTKEEEKTTESVLALPDLEESKAAVLNSLTSKSGQRTYDHAINVFVDWYCSEPRLAFNRTVVLRYRIYLEQKQYAPTTINRHLAAVRRVAYEAADSGLLSPELAAGIRRVKGVRQLGVSVGNWLTVEQGKQLLGGASRDSLPGKKDYAMLAMLIGCGLRRGELPALHTNVIQLREGHWVIADLMGKAGHIRTVPIPDWVKAAIDEWKEAGGIKNGALFRSINKAGRLWGDGMTPKVLREVVREAAARVGIEKLAPHDLRRTCARLCHLAGGELDQSQFLLGHVSIQNDILAASKSFRTPSMTGLALSQTRSANIEGGGRSIGRPLATTRDQSHQY
jgi:integrase